MVEVLVRAQVDRLTLPGRLLEPDDVTEEPQRLLEVWSEQFNVGELRDHGL